MGITKIMSCKEMHGTTPDLLPSYLFKEWWRLKNAGDNIFQCFLRDLKLTMLY